MKGQNCIHKHTGAEGIIKNELKGTKDFPDQWGIYWINKANYGNYANHYYWTDKAKIEIKKQF